jgi:TPR repeat protein
MLGPIDLHLAEHWYRQAADAGLLMAIYDLATLLERAGRYDEARNLYERGASVDDATCLHQLGRMHFFGLGVPRDFSIARTYLERSSSAGNMLAKSLFARALMVGDFGLLQRIRGAALFIGGLIQLPFIVATNFDRNRFR